MVATKTKSFLASVACLATLLVQAPSVAADAPALPRLGRVTEIRTSETASTRVVLPRDIHMFPSFDPDLRFFGDGRVIAFLLVKEGRDGGLQWSQAISGHRLGQCAEIGCEPQMWDGGSMGGRGVGRRSTLRAGTYRLYVVADGAPVTIRLTLPGLEGRSLVRPEGAARAVVKTLTPRLHETNSGLIYSAGNISPFRDGHGLTILGLWLKGVGTEKAAMGDCVYEDDPPAVEAIAYLPEICPRSFYSGYQTSGSAAPDDYTIGFNLTLDGLPAAIGAWYAAQAPVEEAGSVAVWLKTP